ncbi:ATP-grasp domain-containing protein [Microvirga sp. BT688]|uniref:ATP-grasp domain-containing protein n=1 Tax=Microvirga sp. TaxID=1873136 RepID=UPI00168809CB|nr:ATP-grasp domain-containing protein [Microvirga sp.]MBD2745959.1 ATP-grasp domain-containing protein [Microvirga sp.]
MDNLAEILVTPRLASIGMAGLTANLEPVPPYAFVLDRGMDPEERLENAILWKTLKDRAGSQIKAYDDLSKVPDSVTHIFGRAGHRSDLFREGLTYPGPMEKTLPYWTVPGFLELAGRSIKLCDLDQADAEVQRLHLDGKDAFVKATRDKYFTKQVPVGTSLWQALDAMVYSFIDEQACLLVQEYVEMTYEYRLFVVDGQVVTGAGCIPWKTPLDNTALYDPAMIEHRGNNKVGGPAMSNLRLDQYLAFASEAVDRLGGGSFVLDIAMINGDVGIVELNPMRLGQVGIYAANVRALVDAVLNRFG